MCSLWSFHWVLHLLLSLHTFHVIYSNLTDKCQHILLKRFFPLLFTMKNPINERKLSAMTHPCLQYSCASLFALQKMSWSTNGIALSFEKFLSFCWYYLRITRIPKILIKSSRTTKLRFIYQSDVYIVMYIFQYRLVYLKAHLISCNITAIYKI